MLHRTIPLESQLLQQRAKERLIQQSQEYEHLIAPSRKSLPVQSEQDEDRIDPFGKDRSNITMFLKLEVKLKSFSNVSNLLNATGGHWNKKYKSRRNNSLQDYRIIQGGTARHLEIQNGKEVLKTQQKIQREYYRITSINIRQVQTPSLTNSIKQPRKQFQQSHLLVRSIKYRRDAQKEIKNVSPNQKIVNKLKKLIDAPQKPLKNKINSQFMLNTTLSGTNIYHSFRNHKRQEASIKKNSIRSNTCPLQNIQISKTIERLSPAWKKLQTINNQTNEDKKQKKSQTIVLHTLKDRYVSPVRNMEIRLQRNEYRVKALRNNAQFNRANQIQSQIQLAHLASPVISPIFVGDITE